MSLIIFQFVNKVVTIKVIYTAIVDYFISFNSWKAVRNYIKMLAL